MSLPVGLSQCTQLRQQVAEKKIPFNTEVYKELVECDRQAQCTQLRQQAAEQKIPFRKEQEKQLGECNYADELDKFVKFDRK